MRPLELQVSGLHSFRELQTVDFQVLCEGGVFGIFGPTGSGKSSLLDAMTLALYGKVERAANNTQGIMNHAEEELYVSFLFELRNANGSKQYRVERKFKRTGDVSLKTSLSRFLDVSDEENTIVIADKTGEVNQEVQNLLGLTIDDFTRAVVLPQGKFAEFLSLKGSERRQMLQRLFNLEQYGDRLNQKLRERIQTVKVTLEKVTAEQTGLGNASKEALKEAKTALQEAESRLQQKEEQLKKAEQRFDESKLLWELQQQKQKVEDGLEKQKASQSEMDMLRERLADAEAADRLLPYLEDYESAEKAVKDWAEKEKQAKAELEQAKKRFDEAKVRHDEVSQKRKQEEPELIVKREKLKQAKEEQQDIKKWESTIFDLEQDLKQKDSSLADYQSSIQELSNKYERGLEKQKQLKERLQSNTVSVDEREMIRAAAEEKQAIQAELRWKKELEDDIQAKEKHLSLLTERLQEIKIGLDGNVEHHIGLFKKVEHLYHLISDRLMEYMKMQAAGSRLLKKEKAVLEEEKERVLALQLAQQLTEGKECPVCGSTEHPNPAGHKGDVHLEDRKNNISRMESALEEMAKAVHQLERLKFQLEQLSDAIAEVIPEAIQSMNHELMSEAEVLASLEEAETGVDEVVHHLEESSKETKDFGQNVEELTEAVKTNSAEVKKAAKEKDEQQHAFETVAKDLKEQQKKLAQMQEKMDKSLDEWKKNHPELAFDQVEQRQREISQKDKVAATLKESIEKSVHFLEEWEKNLSEWKDERSQLQVKLAEVRSRHGQVMEQKQKLTEKLMKQVGTEDIDQQLSAVLNRFNKLKEEEESASVKKEDAQTALQQAEQQLSIATSSQKQAKQQFETSKERWQVQIGQTDFSTLEKVKAALVDKSVQSEWKERLDRYADQWKQLTGELNKLEETIAGRHVSEEEWTTIKERKETNKAEFNEALQEKGHATNVLAQVTERHRRYLELEEQKAALEKLLEKFGKLQQVFRGNTFVEYIAEEQLIQVSRDASERLGHLTRQRYAIEVDSSGGFIIRDDANGGVRRPVTTLSGGETFLTSLALALSLSAQIQLRGEYPLEFFFLDEGFGTLDQDLLDMVITALEKLHMNNLSVGVISHVQELRERLPRKLIVTPAEPSGKGSSLTLETL